MEEHSAFDWHTLLQDPTFWVMIAFVAFFVMFGKKLAAALTRGLDTRSGTIAHELDQARALREEASAVLALYRKKYAESMQEAEEIPHRAREDAERMMATAEEDLKHLLAARIRMAESKIRQAEKQAVAEVQNHVIDITIAAAKALIVENIQTMPESALVDKAIADIERKVH